MSIFSDVREKMSLEGFLREQGFEFSHFDSGLRARRCVSAACGCDSPDSPKMRLSVRGDFWRCWACGKSGDVSKAASLLWNVRQDAAAKRLLQDQARSSATATLSGVRSGVTVPSVTQQRALESVIRSLRSAASVSDDVRAHLGDRGVSNPVIDQAQACGMVIGLPGDPDRARAWLDAAVGRDRLAAAGLWRPEAPYPALAFRPLLGILGASGLEARKVRACGDGPDMLRYGEAREPYLLRSDPLRGGNEWFVVNGVLEALTIKSIVADSAGVIGLPGASSWRIDGRRLRTEWFANMAKKRVTVILRDEDARVDSEQSTALAFALSGTGALVQNLSTQDRPESEDCLI